MVVKERRKLPLGLLLMSPSSVTLPFKIPYFGTGILTSFPFEARDDAEHPGLIETAFACLLGSADPCPIAVHMEPFPTSVFKVLI